MAKFFCTASLCWSNSNLECWELTWFDSYAAIQHSRRAFQTHWTLQGSTTVVTGRPLCLHSQGHIAGSWSCVWIKLKFSFGWRTHDKIRSKLLTLDVWTPCPAMPGHAWPCLQIRLRLPCSRWPITWRPMCSLLVKVSEAVLSPRFPKPHGMRVTLSWDMPICDLLLTVWNLRALWDGSSEICRTLSDIHVMEWPACTKMGWPGCQVARWSAFPFYPVLRQGTKRPGQLCLLTELKLKMKSSEWTKCRINRKITHHTHKDDI